MKILFIGRNDVGNGMDSEDFWMYEAFLKMGADAYFEEFPLKNSDYTDLDWIFIIKIIDKAEDIKNLRLLFPGVKIAYYTPDYQWIADTEQGFKDMVKQVDLFIGSIQERQPWFDENNIPYLFNASGVAYDIHQKEYDVRVTTHHPQTPYPNEVPIGFPGNWSHNPWRSNILREFQYQFGDGVLHINGFTVNEFRQRDDLRDVHYPLFGHLFNQLIGITKINLSMESMGNKNFWGGRIGQILGAGGFALVWYCKNMERYFGRSGENVVYFYNTQDGIDKAKYYLDHEDERKTIAERGHNFANENLRPTKFLKPLYEALNKKIK